MATPARVQRNAVPPRTVKEPLRRRFATVVDDDAAIVVRKIRDVIRAAQPPEAARSDEDVLAEALGIGLHAMALQHLGNGRAWNDEDMVGSADAHDADAKLGDLERERAIAYCEAFVFHARCNASVLIPLEGDFWKDETEEIAGLLTSVAPAQAKMLLDLAKRIEKTDDEYEKETKKLRPARRSAWLRFFDLDRAVLNAGGASVLGADCVMPGVPEELQVDFDEMENLARASEDLVTEPERTVLHLGGRHGKKGGR